MQLRTLSPPAAGHPADAVTLRRALTAVLRRRIRLLPGLSHPRSARAARLVPVLLHASFDRPGLRTDAPGVTGLAYRRSWTRLARAFDLPPPHRAQRAAPLVEAVAALPAGERLQVVVLTAPGLRGPDRRWVEERAAAAQAVLNAGGARLAIEVADPEDLGRDPRLGHRLVAWGALPGGRLPPAAWAALERTGRRPIEPHGMASLAADAPTAIATLALTVISGRPAPAPHEVAARLARGGEGARRIADPSFLCTAWAAEARPELAGELRGALALAGGAEAGADGAEGIVTLAGRLRLAAARAIHAARHAGLAPDDAALWRERVGVEVPRALLPALSSGLAARPLATTLHRAGPTRHEVRLAGGAVIGRGATPVQARIRALSVIAATALEPLLAHAEAPWRGVAARLAQRRDRPTLLLVVEPAGPSGPPFDPLNRGPDRALGFPGALLVRLVPGRRPSARVLTGEQALDRLVREVLGGSAIEVLPARSEAHPVAARLAQIAGLLREGSADAPVAIEAGGRVLLLARRRLRHFALDRFAARPRLFIPDPDAPDLALSPGERRPPGLGRPGVIECRAELLDDRRAAVLYADGAGASLREVVSLGELEEHLREARALLQAADAGALLAVRLSTDLEPALRRAGRAPTPVPVAVRARLPWDVQVEVGDDWYGGTTGRGWREAGLALLDAWPRGEEARIAFSGVTAVAQGRRRGGLLALYVRSLVRRRLLAQVVRTLRAYRDRGTRRSGG